MKPTLDQYQTNLSRQPRNIRRHIQRGEALGRLLLRLASYLRRLYWHVHEEQQPAAHGTSIRNVMKAQKRSAQTANDENYKSAA